MGRARELANLFSGGSADINVKTSDGGILNLQTSDTTVTQDSVVGSIQFQAPDEASGTDSILVASKIEAVAEGTFSASSNATSLVFSTASSAVAGTVAGKMTFTSGGELVIKDTDTADGSSPTITLQSGDTDIAQDDVLGTINFQAPDEGTGTDAILVAAGIAAVSEGDFSSSSNATKLVFKTGSSEAASEKMSLSSAGLLTVADDIVIGDGKTIGSSSDPDAIAIGSDGDVTLTQDLELQHDGATISFGANDDIQLIHVHNEGVTLKAVDTGGNSGLGPVLNLSTGDTDIAAGNQLGTINFQAPDEGTGTDAILVGASITAMAQADFSSSVNSTSLIIKTSTSGTNDGGMLELTPTGDVNIRNQNSADDSFPTLTLQTGDTDIAQNDVLGKISFQAPSEGAGTDAVLAGASIRAISEGDFSASNNATTLEFMTGASEAPTRRMRISSTGETTITRAGSVTDHGGLLRLNGTYSSNNNGPNIMFHGTATDQYPSMQILNYSHDDQSINFDSYYNTSGSWISSDAGSNIQIYKRSDTLSFAMEDSIAAGSAITWKDHYKMTVSGGGTHTWYNTASGSGVMSVTGNTDYAYLRRSWLAWTDNNYDLGHASNRWDDIFATNSTINTSDENQKKDIADSDLGTDFIKALKPKKFKFKDGTRQHYGLIAQDVEKLLSDSSIDTKDFAGFIKTPTYKPKIVDVLDREDKKIDEYEEIGEETDENFKEYRYGLRLNEFIAPMIKMLQEQQAKIETLESEVTKLKSE